MSNIGLVSLLLYLFVVLVGISFVFIVYKLINKSTLENDKIDKFIEYLKWALITLSLPTVAIIVANFYQERREAIEEMKYFEKYTEDVRDLSKLEQRRQLVRYFATVAPNSRLKGSWEDYLDTINKDYKRSVTLDSLERVLNKDSINNVKRLDSIKNERNKIDAQMKSSKDFVNAKKHELAGFKFLIDKDVNSAIESFTESENSYNGFHNVYEIGRYLSKNKDNLLNKNATEWKSVYKMIDTKYSWEIPEIYKKEIIKLSN
ncbi:hypothetical protein [Flavobacterium sp. N502540]|uniref:hypothetical protein n=1 Tax=Flavobacterium sp. N502540 TaxID=2986838 RepID=UPI002224320C|nr:hypothetical protein [Flavobacterium sp. N502540]